jgi:hypothetical protein|tara:strand:+ start:565 stop:1314 length:750 start_codon:yes stop_codon:yes gene_type:complete
MSYRNPNSFLRFADLVASGEKDIAKSNLFSVEITLPPMLYATGRAPNYREHYESINYFADSVTIPARRIKTQSVKTVGMPYDYAYGQQKQEVRMSFIMTKDMYHRQFFENWMNLTASDAENRVTFYDEYTADIQILKWENGANVVYKGSNNFNGRRVNFEQRMNRSTAVWQMYGAYPFDISAMSLNNGPADLLKIDVDFKYERFRFDTVAEDILSFSPNANDKVIRNFDEIFTRLGFATSQADSSFFGT